ncbi:MAG: DNA polymerase I [Candidatus Tantalella remota]|nr:DNA polymerase I [Candidatus Tantalella remota]
MNTKTKNIYLIDGNSLCYRAFYAIRELTTSKGMPTNAIYGVVNMLRKLMKEHDPEMLVMVFDMKGPTVRHKKYEEYKMHRKPMPDDLVDQMPRIKEVVEAYNIPTCQLEGYEADDIIATLAERSRKNGWFVTIVTGDKDAFQLVDDKVKVLSAHTAGEKVYGPDEVVEKYGVGPEQMVDLMALMGDQSDNIPGVKGVGKVTAAKLVKEFGCLSGIYSNIDKVSSDSLRKKLADDREMADLSRELVELDREVPVDLDLLNSVVSAPDSGRLAELFREFEFGKLLAEIVPKTTEETKYSRKEDLKDVKALLGELKKKKVCAVTYEVDDEGRPDGLALSIKEGEGCFFPVSLSKSDPKGWKQLLEGIFEDENILKAGYDMKDDIRLLVEEGISASGSIFDVMIADYLIDPARPKYDLESMAMRHLEYNLAHAGGQMEWGSDGQATMGMEDKEDHLEACESSDMILRLYAKLAPVLKKKELDKLFFEVEMPLVNILAEMELDGVGIDIAYLKKQSKEIDKKLDGVTKKIYDLAGEEFNINSPKQLQVILYEKLSLPALKKTKTGISTDESVLSRLAPMHEFPRILLEYRELNKLKTAYYDSILELVDKKEHRLHARFNQAVTATGRLSSSEPNLQNIPIKTPLGKEIRKAFVPGKKDLLLVAADYSQIELRVLAHLSQDKKLIEAFNKGEDVHKFTAALMFECELSEVTDKMRSAAKTVNFGIVYGMGAFRLAKDLGINVSEAQDFIDAYFKRYKGVSSYINKTIEGAREKGFVTTLLNRRRYIPEINVSNERVKGFAERVAVNTPVQGSAADVIKLAMIGCHEEFSGTGVKMIIQVHDELVFEVPKDMLDEAVSRIRDRMEKVLDLEVPLKVDVEAGSNWLEMDEMEA